MSFVIEVIRRKSGCKFINLDIFTVYYGEKMSSVGEFDLTATPDRDTVIFLEFFLKNVEHANTI